MISPRWNFSAMKKQLLLLLCIFWGWPLSLSSDAAEPLPSNASTHALTQKDEAFLQSIDDMCRLMVSQDNSYPKIREILSQNYGEGIVLNKEENEVLPRYELFKPSKSPLRQIHLFSIKHVSILEPVETTDDISGVLLRPSHRHTLKIFNWPERFKNFDHTFPKLELIKNIASYHQIMPEARYICLINVYLDNSFNILKLLDINNNIVKHVRIAAHRVTFTEKFLEKSRPEIP